MGRGKRPERGLRQSEQEGELPIVFAEHGVNTTCEERRAVRGNREGGGEPWAGAHFHHSSGTRAPWPVLSRE